MADVVALVFVGDEGGRDVKGRAHGRMYNCLYGRVCLGAKETVYKVKMQLTS
jgi:hypothetical protein